MAEDDETSPNLQSAVTILVVATTAAPDTSAPSVPDLVSPSNGAAVNARVVLKWNKASDSDGDAVTHQYYVCEDDSFAGCDPVTASMASLFENRRGESLDFKRFNPLINEVWAADFTQSETEAFSWFGPFAIGILLLLSLLGRGIVKDRKKYSLVLATLMLAGLLVTSCASSDEDEDAASDIPGGGSEADTSITLTNLTSGTIYYWKVVATDDESNSTPSEVRSFAVN